MNRTANATIRQLGIFCAFAKSPAEATPAELAALGRFGAAERAEAQEFLAAWSEQLKHAEPAAPRPNGGRVAGLNFFPPSSTVPAPEEQR